MLAIRDGKLDIGSVVRAPFGRATDLDVRQYTPLADWSSDSLEI